MNSPSFLTIPCQLGTRKQFLDDVVSGLSAKPKSLPSKYFYDAVGSRLFDRICTLDEYYLTRTELAIMDESAREIGREIGPQAMIVEFGSGSSRKTRILLDNLPRAAAYVPIDISRQHLFETAAALRREYRQIEILPLCADFNQPFSLPKPAAVVRRRVVYFPGSTLGNFEPCAAAELLRRIAMISGLGGGLLIGIDLQKDAGILEAAYNDSAGVTVAFNKNLLRRINHELGANFDLRSFRHRAVYNSDLGRIEISLVSLQDQTVTLDGRDFHLASNEAITTEYSYKYTVKGFERTAADAGVKIRRTWTDPSQFFAVLYGTVES